MRLPDFMVIGAAKSATTSLHNLLRQHPDIWLSTPKEPTFYSNPEINARGLSWYSSLFEEAEEHQICGEASTTYMRWPFKESPNNRDPWPDISKIDKELRFIYMVRHPVDRAYSHYGHHMRRGCTMSFEDALDRNSIYIDTSRYADQLRHFRTHMPDAPLLILDFEQFVSNQQECMNQVFEFLGVKACDSYALNSDEMNLKGPEHIINHTINRFPILRGARRLVPSSMRGGLRSALLASPIGKLAHRRSSTTPMRPETRSRLIELFEPDICHLEELMNRPLPKWRS